MVLTNKGRLACHYLWQPLLVFKLILLLTQGVQIIRGASMMLQWVQITQNFPLDNPALFNIEQTLPNTVANFCSNHSLNCEVPGAVYSSINPIFSLIDNSSNDLFSPLWSLLKNFTVMLFCAFK